MLCGYEGYRNNQITETKSIHIKNELYVFRDIKHLSGLQNVNIGNGVSMTFIKGVLVSRKHCLRN